MKVKIDNLTLIWLMIFGFMAGSLMSCTEKSAQQPAPVSGTSTDDDDGDGYSSDDDDDDPSVFDVCSKLEDGDLSSFEDLTKLLCGSGDHSIKSLRSNYYSGSGTPSFELEDDENGGTSEFVLSSAIKAPVSAEDYYDLMKLKFSDPDQFSDDGYAVGEGVEYNVLNTSDSVEFSYKNTKYELDSPASLVEYEAKSYFHRLKSAQLYVIATDMTESIDTVNQLTGLIVINALSSSKSEIISISIQEMENAGEHKTSVDRMKDSSEDEIKIAFENAEKKGNE